MAPNQSILKQDDFWNSLPDDANIPHILEKISCSDRDIQFKSSLAHSLKEYKHLWEQLAKA